MSQDMKFIELLNETRNLLAHRDPIYPTVASILREELVKRAPAALLTLELEPFEAIFAITVGLEGDPCDEVIKEFTEFWCSTTRERIKCKLDLLKSLESGKLKKFVQKKSRRWRIGDGIEAKLYEALLVSQPDSIVS